MYYKVKTVDIDYYVDYNDVYDEVSDEFGDLEDEDPEGFELIMDHKIAEIIDSLPQALEFEFFDVKNKTDLEELVPEAISAETYWLVNGCTYKIIEEKE